MISLDRIVPAPADRVLVSPNSSRRPAGAGIRCIVLHATADRTDEGAERWMRDPKSQVSAHLHIRRDGSVTRLVDDHHRAWHAGRSAWGGQMDVNDFSLGWEIANDNRGEPYTEAQYATLIRLGAHYVRQGLPLGTGFASHEEVALPVGRKTDPYGFRWVRFILGVGAAVHQVDLTPVVPPLPQIVGLR